MENLSAIVVGLITWIFSDIWNVIKILFIFYVLVYVFIQIINYFQEQKKTS